MKERFGIFPERIKAKLRSDAGLIRYTLATSKKERQQHENQISGFGRSFINFLRVNRETNIDILSFDFLQVLAIDQFVLDGTNRRLMTHHFEPFYKDMQLFLSAIVGPMKKSSSNSLIQSVCELSTRENKAHRVFLLNTFEDRLIGSQTYYIFTKKPESQKELELALGRNDCTLTGNGNRIDFIKPNNSLIFRFCGNFEFEGVDHSVYGCNHQTDIRINGKKIKALDLNPYLVPTRV